MKWILIVLVFILSVFAVYKIAVNNNESLAPTNAMQERYVALGDSYTIGQGIDADDAWPHLLARHLREKGVAIELVETIAVTGWSTQNIIDQAMPQFEKSNPTFATLQIGVNDWVGGVTRERFQANLRQILDMMQAKLPDKNKIVLVTIPDYSVTPTGKEYADGRDTTKGIQDFNTIIMEEGKIRNLPVVDIFTLSQQMGKDVKLLAPDALHPSTIEYIFWEEQIFPAAFALLQTPSKSDVTSVVTPIVGTSQRVTLEGRVICLTPKPDSGIYTAECIIGLRSDNGLDYVLNTGLMSTPPVQFGVNDHIRANGVLTPIEYLSTDQWQHYTVEGVFSATDSFEKVEML